jgi:hypothetical protein
MWSVELIRINNKSLRIYKPKDKTKDLVAIAQVFHISQLPDLIPAFHAKVEFDKFSKIPAAPSLLPNKRAKPENSQNDVNEGNRPEKLCRLRPIEGEMLPRIEDIALINAKKYKKLMIVKNAKSRLVLLSDPCEFI